MRLLTNLTIIICVFLYSCSKKTEQENDSQPNSPLPAKKSGVIDESKEIIADTATKTVEMKPDANVTLKTEQLEEIKVDQEKTTPEIKAAVEEKHVIRKAEDKEIEEEISEVQKIVLPDHSAWDNLMKKYVSSDGKVSYSSLKGEKMIIDAYIKQVITNKPADDVSRNIKLAFWINLYNAVTVKLILDHYPLKSIKDINGGKAWDLKLVTIDNKTLSLNDIEHGIIRKQFNEPRIHFAVNCAAKSCPKLLNAAYLPSTLDKQLDKQTRYFIFNKNKNQVSKLSLSKIFDWYGSDFGDVKAFIEKYESSIDRDQKIVFLEYDWALNE